MRYTTIAVILALAGCTKDPGGAYGALRSPEVTFTAEGTGPENTLPLEPMLPGFEATLGRVFTFRWSASLDAGHDDVAASESVSDSFAISPTGDAAYGDDIGLHRMTDEGVVLYGTNEHLVGDAIPVLLVPATVRLGMAWESERSDGSVIAQTVVGHEQVQLPIGPVEAWGIRDDASEIVRWYGEGVGRLGIGMGTTFGMDRAYTDFIVPETAQAGTEAPLDPSMLTPLVDAFGHTLALRSPLLLGLSSAVRDDGWWLYTHGFAPSYCPNCTDAPADWCIKMGVIPEWYVGGEHEACPLLAWQYNGDSYPYTMVSANSLMPGESFALPDDTTGHPSNAEGGSDGNRLYTWRTPDGIRCLNADLTVWTSTSAPCDTLPLNVNGAPVSMVDEISHRAMYMNGWTDFSGVQFIGPIETASADAPLHLAAIDRVGRVFRLSVEDGRIHGFVPVGVISGQRTVFVTDEAREGWSITKDGRIFRVRVDATTGDVSIDSLGDVALDDTSGQNTPVGVAPDPEVPGDVIVAVSVAAVDRDGSGFIDQVPRYTNTLFRATLLHDPVPLRTPPSLLIGAREELGAQLVCWPPSDAPFDDSGWLLGGKAPERVIPNVGPGGDCALVVPDGEPDPAFAAAPDALTANVPGVGKVRIGTTNRSSTYLGNSGSVLRDGTLIDANGQRFDEHGVYLGGSGNLAGLASWPNDIGGYGQWLHTTSGPTIVHNLGGGIPSVDCGGTCHIWGAIEGGGILLAYPDRHVDAVRPDGITTLPEGQQYRPGLLLKDGRVCWPKGGLIEPLQVDCFDAAGEVTTTNQTEGPDAIDSMWPIPGGFLVHGEDLDTASFFFDPKTMTLTPISERNVIRPVTAVDGDVYGVAEWYDAAEGQYLSQVVQVTADGLDPIGPEVPGAGVLTVYPLADQLLIEGAGWSRIPR